MNIPISFGDVIVTISNNGVNTPAYNKNMGGCTRKAKINASLGEIECLLPAPNPCKQITMYEVAGNYIMNTSYSERLRNQAQEYNKQHHDNKTIKNFAAALYPYSDGYRHASYDSVFNGQTIERVETNMDILMRNGFQGLDCDLSKELYSTSEDMTEMAAKIKTKMGEWLMQFPWVMMVTMSTGGHGIHVYTAHKMRDFEDDDIEGRRRYHALWFAFASYTMWRGYVRFADEIGLDIESGKNDVIDKHMMKPSQPLNVTPLDIHPIINQSFEYKIIDDFEQIFDNGATTIELSSHDLKYSSMCDEDKEAYVKFRQDIDIDYTPALAVENTTDVDVKINIGKENHTDFTPQPTWKPTYFRHAKHEGYWTLSSLFILLYHAGWDSDTIIRLMHCKDFYTNAGDPAVDDYVRWYSTRYAGLNINWGLLAYLNENYDLGIRIYTDRNEHIMPVKETVITLEDDEYLGTPDKKELIINNLVTGFNLLIAPTGTGKTELAKQLNREIIYDTLATSEQPILICEPYNSIIESKYDDNEVNKCMGGTHINMNKTGNNLMDVVNYNKLIERTPEDLSKYRYVIIDESHLLSESYRSDTIIPMIDLLNKASKNAVIIFMTGTPMDEREYFDVKSIIRIQKKPKANIVKIFRKYEPVDNEKFDIMMIKDLVLHYLNEEKRKVFIYCPNISYDRCRCFKELNPEMKIVIYHKKMWEVTDAADEGMTYINSEHKLGDKFDVLISSVYFSVGNDLNDECDAACIIIGNHSWQEELQVIGRWRNSKDIAVCQIIDDADKIVWFDNKDHLKRITNMENKMMCMLQDKSDFNQSITIKGASYAIKDETYVHPLAVMKANDYYSNMEVKNRELLKYGVDVLDDNNYQDVLRFNNTWHDIEETFWKHTSSEYKNNMDVIYNKIAAGQNVSTTTGNASWDKLTNQLYRLHSYDNDLFKMVLTYGWHRQKHMKDLIPLWINMDRMARKDIRNNPELLGWMKYCEIRDRFNEVHRDDVRKNVKKSTDADKDMSAIVTELGITEHQFAACCGFVIFETYRDKDDKDDLYNADYFYSFMRNAYLYWQMPTEMKKAVFKYIDTDKIDIRETLREITSGECLVTSRSNEVISLSGINNDDKLTIFNEKINDCRKINGERTKKTVEQKRNAGRKGGNAARKKSGRKGIEITLSGRKFKTVKDAMQETGLSFRQIKRLLKEQ